MPARRDRSGAVALATVLVLLAAGCASGSGPSAGDATWDGQADATEEIHAAVDHAEVWAAELVTGFDEHADLEGDPQSPAAELLAGLDLDLREHVVLVTDASAAIIAGQDRAAQRTRDALEENTVALEDQVRTLFSQEAGDDFQRLWSRHVEQLLDVATALRDDDEDTEDQALAELERLNGELVGLVRDLTAGRTDPTELEDSLAGHVDTTVATMEAQAADDGSRYERLREAVTHMAHVAERLAGPFAEAAVVDGEVDTRAATIHAELSGLMAQTVWFTSIATGHAVTGEDVGPPRSLVGHNTGELAGLVGDVLSPDTEERFERVWGEHLDLLIEYAGAVEAGDADAERRLREELHAWETEIGEVLAAATGEALEAVAVERSARMHVDAMVAVVEAQGQAS